MTRVSVPSSRKEVLTRVNYGKTRTAVRFGGSPLGVVEWSSWKSVNLDQRIASWRGLSPKQKGDYVHSTSVVYYKGSAYGNADAGVYGARSFTYGVISSETKSEDYAVYHSPFNLGYSDDPRNLTWNIGGHLSLARYGREYNYLAHHIRKQMSDPIVDMGLITAESLMTKRAFEKIALDLLHVLKFVKNGDVLGAVKIAFGNTNVNAIGNRGNLPIRRRIKTRNGKQYVYTGRSGKGRTQAELRAMHPSGRWLEYSFGIAPVISDVQDLASLRDGTYDVPSYRFAKSLDISAGDGTEGKLRMVAKCNLTDPYARYLQQLGTHATQVYALAWELVPLSWLIDYAIDVGGMLSYLSSSVGLTYKDACWSIKIVGKDLEASGGGPHSGWNCLNSYSFYERDVLPSIPIPTHPRILKVLNSGKQQSNLMAFIIQAFSGHTDKRIIKLG